MDDEKFKRHLTPTEKFNIGDDEFELKPLPYKYMSKFWKLAKHAAKMFPKNSKEGDMSDEETMAMFENMDDELMELLIELSVQTMYTSYPNKDKKLMEEFAQRNYIQMFPLIISLNTPQSEGNIPNVNTEKNKSIS